MIVLCNFCGFQADNEKGIIFVRATITYLNLTKIINAPICVNCFNKEKND